MAAGAALFLGVFGLYMRTMCGSYDVVDGGEFLSAGASLGVAHPPGYPLFVLAERLLLAVPAGGPEFRMALLAPLAGAAAAAAAAMVLRRVWGAAAGWLAAAAIAVQPAVWAQGTGLKDAANLWHLWAAVVVCGAFAIQAGPRAFLAAALALGLASANLAAGAIALWAAALVSLAIVPAARSALSGRRIGLVAVMAALAVSSYLVLPIRAAAAPAVCWGDWHRLHGVGRVAGWLVGWVHTDFFHMDWAGWRLHRGLVTSLVVAAAAGGILGRRADRGNPVWTLSALAAVAVAWGGLAKDVARGELQYLLPLFPFAAVGAAGVARWAPVRPAVVRWIVGGAAAALIVLGIGHARDRDRSRYYLMHDMTANVIRSLPDRASTVLCFGDYEYDALRWRQIGWGERSSAALVHLRIVLLAPAHGDHLAELGRIYPGFRAPRGGVTSPAELDALAAAIVSENSARGPVFAEAPNLVAGSFWVRLRAIPSCPDGFLVRLGGPCASAAAQNRRVGRFRFRGVWDPSVIHDRWDVALAEDARATAVALRGMR